MSITTRTGDEGTTSLLFNRRVPKTHERIEACGAVDELNAALGTARALATDSMLAGHLAQAQQPLVALMGELAVAPEDKERYATSKLPKLTHEPLAGLDRLVASLESQGLNFDGWATPGANPLAAAIEVARTVCRRAERRICALGPAAHPLAIRHLNRLADALWLLARYAESPAPPSCPRPDSDG
jgi:cob(I)alamin adenosyltransferase